MDENPASTLRCRLGELDPQCYAIVGFGWPGDGLGPVVVIDQNRSDTAERDDAGSSMDDCVKEHLSSSPAVAG